MINIIWNWIFELYSFKVIYKITGLFFTRRFKKATVNHKYAILVAARNEEKVVGNLVDSIRKQDYPQELVTIFVVADNCTDNTAEVSRQQGAICYERFDPDHRTKGFALQYLVKCIDRDYGIDAFEGYFIFDADNLLKSDYLKNMNESFDAGEKIITSYRNTKNFDDNWISASYGVHWIRTIRNEHRARSLFHLATRIQGTGFLFAWEVIKDGWNYTSLTEDRAFCADAVANGYKISYNNKAEFYDEQPIDIKTAFRQRIRWSKGHLQALVETGPQLFSHIFVTKGMANKHLGDKKETTPVWKLIFNNIRLRFMSFDMLTVVLPKSFVSFVKTVLVYILKIILIFGGSARLTQEYSPNIIQKLFEDFGIVIPQNSVFSFIFFVFTSTFLAYMSSVLTAVYVYLIEYKRIKKIKLSKKKWFCLTFPLFDIIGTISLFIALFRKVEWTPIVHSAAINIDEIENKKN